MAQTRTEKIVIDGLKARQTKERNFKFLAFSLLHLLLPFSDTFNINMLKRSSRFFQYYATFEVELTREQSILG